MEAYRGVREDAPRFMSHIAGHRLALRAGQLGAHLQAAEALGQAKQGVGIDPSGCVVVHVQRVGMAHCVAIIVIIIIIITVNDSSTAAAA